MEEKLYFKPATYGKGTKRKEKEPRHRICNLLILFLCLGIIVVVVFLLTRGKSTTTGEYPSPVSTQSLLCKKSGVQYPKITGADSDNKNIEIAMIFNGMNNLSKISLDYTLYYATEAEVERASVSARIQFRIDLGGTNFPVTVFDNKFSSYDDRLVVSMFGSQTDIEDELRASYFMIDSKQSSLQTLDDFKTTYEQQGFSCASTTENNKSN